MNPSVVHNEPESRFELDLQQATALLDYSLDGNRIAFTHTEVPPEFEGRSYGTQLARAALDYARQSGLTVVPACSFVAAFIRRNPQYLDMVSPEYRERLAPRRAKQH
jgi:uncharacterized protein